MSHFCNNHAFEDQLPETMHALLNMTNTFSEITVIGSKSSGVWLFYAMIV